jgi:integrase/recombinase XerD
MRPTEHGFVGPLAGELEEHIRFKASMGRHGATLCFSKLASAL